uniref:cytotoxic T-lymphocyte protein 4-like n=1 Tax=Pristiophorus japonicus TaxID=55135 RepID=UPI00398F08C2
MKYMDQFVASFICLLAALKIPALAMKVTQPRLIIAERHNVTLECAYNITGDGQAEEFRITILKGKKKDNIEVCAASFNFTVNHFERTTELHCLGQPRKDGVSITFNGLNTSHSDWYICKVEKMHPPPYIEGFGTATWIFIRPDTTEMKPCHQFTQATLIVLVFAVISVLYIVLISCRHWPLGAAACILRMKEAVDMKCELIHNSDEPATATWTGQRWETGPSQDVEKEPRRTEQ